MRSSGGQQLWLPGVEGVPAMDVFPDGAFVRLRNRAQQTYLHADHDAEGGLRAPARRRLRPERGVAGAPHRLRREHLRAPPERRLRPQPRDPARPAAVRLRRPPRRPERLRRARGGHPHLEAPEEGRRERYVVLRMRPDHNRNLRANGRFRVWHTAVTVGTVDTVLGRWSTMMQWTISRFELAPGLPPLPHPTVILGARSGLLRRRKPEADQRRTIRHVRANDEGDFDQEYRNWPAFRSYGRSVFNLRTQVGTRQPGEEPELGDGITLAVRPGFNGRLTPLVTDLPRSVDTMDIVVFNAGSQSEELRSSLNGAQNFMYPDIL